jgi:hypothetical protein
VPKATQAEIAKRVDEVLQVRLAGGGFPEILQYAAENGWEVQERQLWEYVRRSNDLVAQSLEKDRGQRLLLHLAQRRLLYHKALEVGDLRTALAVLRDSAQLEDLYPATRFKLEDRDLDQAIDHGLAELAAAGEGAAAGAAEAAPGLPPPAGAAAEGAGPTLPDGGLGG